MIYGALGDIEEYRGMLKGLDVLIDWLEENDPAKLEVGSFVVPSLLVDIIWHSPVTAFTIIAPSMSVPPKRPMVLSTIGTIQYGEPLSSISNDGSSKR